MGLRRFSPDINSGSKNRPGHEKFDSDHKDLLDEDYPDDEGLDGVDKKRLPGRRLEDAREFMSLDDEN